MIERIDYNDKSGTGTIVMRNGSTNADVDFTYVLRVDADGVRWVDLIEAGDETPSGWLDHASRVIETQDQGA